MPKRPRNFSNSRVAKKRRTVSNIRRRRKLWRATRGTTIGRSLGFPKMLKFKHKYVDDISLTAGATTQRYLFACNGMYDPDITGTGHQPLFFDQLTELYNHYHVIGSKIKYTIVPAGTSVQVPFKVISTINDDSTPSVSTAAEEEQTKAIVRYCQGGVNPDKLFITQSWSAKKNFGNVMSNDELKGNSGANPTETSCYQLSLRPLDGITSVTVYIHVEISFIAIWNELKEVNQS